MDIPLDIENYLINNFLDIKTLLILKKTNKKNFNIIQSNKFNLEKVNLYSYILKGILYKDIYFLNWLKKNGANYNEFSSFAILLSDNLSFIKSVLCNFGLYSKQLILELYMINIRKGKFSRSFFRNLFKYTNLSSNLMKILKIIYKYPNLYKKKRFKYNEIVKLILVKYLKLNKDIKDI